MTVYFDDSRGRGRWRYDFVINGQRYHGNCVDAVTGAPVTTKTGAKRAEALARAQALKAIPPVSQPATYTFAQMAAAYATRKKTLKDWPNKKVYLAELISYFGADSNVADITDQRVWDYISWSREQPVTIYRGGPKARTAEDRAKHYTPTDRKRSDSTTNRYLVTLREALTIAAAVKDSQGRPAIISPPKVPKLAEPEAMPRPVSDNDLQAIIATAPQHLADGVMLTRLMGFRKAEVFSLTVDQVDFQNRCVWLAAAETKGNRAEAVPANPAAIELLTRLVNTARQEGTPYLLTFKRGAKGQPIPVKNPKRAWATVMRKLGLTHRFHDTKASFVTAVAHVAPAAVTQQLARHKSYDTTRRYLRIADTASRQAVDAATFQPSRSPTQISHARESGTKNPDETSKKKKP